MIFQRYGYFEYEGYLLAIDIEKFFYLVKHYVLHAILEKYGLEIGWNFFEQSEILFN